MSHQKSINTNWWKKSYNAHDGLYLTTNARSVGDDNLTKKEVDSVIRKLKPKRDEKILDLCCGQGRHSLELARRGCDITGLDYSKVLLRKAREKAKGEGLKAVFNQGDARSLTYQKEFFDLVINMGNSFAYWLEKKGDNKFLGEVWRVLKPKGRFLMDVTNGEYMKEHFKPNSWHQATDDLFVLREKKYNKNLQGIIAKEIVVSKQKGLVNEFDYFERLYSPRGIKRLLEKTGFRVLEVDSSQTDKKGDLGFMANRLLIVAQKNE